MAVKIQVAVVCVVTQCSVAVEYQRFGAPCCLHLQDQVTETLVSYRNIMRRHKPEYTDLNPGKLTL
jgi:hypothetical protein